MCRIQSLFSSLGEEVKGKTIALGGDGRYFNKEAAQIIIKLAAGNGVKKIIVGQNGILATPAASALIRRRSLYGAQAPALQPTGRYREVAAWSSRPYAPRC